MFARIGAKALLLVAAAALVFFGLGLLGLALAGALTARLGSAGAEAVAGGVLLLPVLLWGLITAASCPPRPAPPPPPKGLAMGILSALSRDTPWVAVVTAGLAGAADAYFNRNKTKPKR